jgi:hypothetical protein
VLTQRSLTDRLAGVRYATKPVQPARAAPDDRLASLARWFDARTDTVEGSGTALIVERSVPLDPEVESIQATLPPAAYFDTETTGLSTGAGTVIFMAAVARLEGPWVTVRQYVLPDFP